MTFLRKLPYTRLCVAIAVLGGLVVCGLFLLPLWHKTKPEHGQTLVVAVAEAPVSFDPRYATDAASIRLLELLTYPLLYIDDKGKIESNLLENMVQNNNILFKFSTKKESNFDDKTRINNKYIVAYLSSILAENSTSPLKGTLQDVQSITVENAQVVIRLKRENPWFWHVLANIFVVLPGEGETLEKQIQNPVGFAAYKLVEHRRDGSVLLEKENTGNQRVPQVLFKVMSQPLVRLFQLMRGDVHVVYNDIPLEMYTYATQHGFSGQSVPSDSYTYMGFNMQQGVTAHTAVRQALAYAINTQELIDNLFYGHAVPAGQLVPVDGKNQQLPTAQVPYQPQKAAALLNAAGFQTNRQGWRFDLRLAITNNPLMLRVAQVVQQQLAAVGVNVRIESSEWGSFYGNIKKGNFQSYIMSWVGSFQPNFYNYVFNSAMVPPYGANRGLYRNAEMDNDLTVIMHSPSQTQRIQATLRVQQRQFDDMIYLPLWRKNHLMLTQGVKNCVLQTNGGYAGLTRCQFIENGVSK